MKENHRKITWKMKKEENGNKKNKREWKLRKGEDKKMKKEKHRKIIKKWKENERSLTENSCREMKKKKT